MRVGFLLALIVLAAACNRREPAPDPAAPVSAPDVSVPASPPPDSPSASASTPPANATAANAAPSPDGEKLFLQNCATCHMANGSGVPFLQPDIRGSAWLSNEDPQPLLSLMLRGSVALGEAAGAYENDMAPFSHLSDAEIAALSTHVRTRFGAPPPTAPVTAAEVATARSRPGMPWAGK